MCIRDRSQTCYQVSLRNIVTNEVFLRWLTGSNSAVKRNKTKILVSHPSPQVEGGETFCTQHSYGLPDRWEPRDATQSAKAVKVFASLQSEYFYTNLKYGLHPYVPNPLSRKPIVPNPIVPISYVPNLNVPIVQKP